jgi:S1-C subfamily serine protease
VIRNYHVIHGARSVSVRVPSKEPVRVTEITTNALETEITELVSVCDHVVAIGAPLGLESTVSEGIVSATRDVNRTHIVRTTASISPGSSGGRF